MYFSKTNSYFYRLLDTCQGRCVDTCLILLLVFEHIDQNLAEYITKSQSDGKLEPEDIKVILNLFYNFLIITTSEKLIYLYTLL